MSVVQLLDLPDELLLDILKKVDPQALLLCSMIDVGNHRLEQLAFDRCHSVDLSFDYCRAAHRSLMKRFYSHVMPRICHDIQSLTITYQHMSSIKNFIEKNCNGTLRNLTHLKFLLGVKHDKTGVPYTIANYAISDLTMREPLFAVVPQLFAMPNFGLGEKIATFFCSSLLQSVQSLELDDNCVFGGIFVKGTVGFSLPTRLTHVRISLWGMYECIQLLNAIGSQLHSFIVTIPTVSTYQLPESCEVKRISCPNLKQMILIMYRNFSNYKPCISLLQRLSNVEHLTLLLAIGTKDSKHNHFIDGVVLERDILPYMPHLRQFHFHIRSIVKNASHITNDQIRQTLLKQQQPFDCVLDHFKNKYRQCQIYSLPFIGTRLDFISNRFPLFDSNNKFSNVTTLLLFDDIKPFENIFFERLAQSLPQLQTLEIINQLEQQEKTAAVKTNIIFAHLAVLILYDIHMDYAEQFLYQLHLSSLTELVIGNDILFKIMAENDQQARENCSRVGTLHTYIPSNESTDIIRNFFPLAYHMNRWRK